MTRNRTASGSAAGNVLALRLPPCTSGDLDLACVLADSPVHPVLPRLPARGDADLAFRAQGAGGVDFLLALVKGLITLQTVDSFSTQRPL